MPFEEKVLEVWNKLGNAAVMVLATEYEGLPYARSVSVIIANQKIYFQTDWTMDKAIHIRKNKNHYCQC